METPRYVELIDAARLELGRSYGMAISKEAEQELLAHFREAMGYEGNPSGIDTYCGLRVWVSEGMPAGKEIVFREKPEWDQFAYLDHMISYEAAEKVLSVKEGLFWFHLSHFADRLPAG